MASTDFMSLLNNLDPISKNVFTYGVSAVFVLYFFVSNYQIGKNILKDQSNSAFWKKIFMLNLVFTFAFGCFIAFINYKKIESELLGTKQAYCSDLLASLEQKAQKECQDKCAQISKDCEKVSCSYSFSGKITNLKNDLSVTSEDLDIYFRHIKTENDFAITKWGYISASPLRIKENIEFNVYRIFNKNGERLPSAEKLYSFEVPTKCLAENSSSDLAFDSKVIPKLIFSCKGEKRSCPDKNYIATDSQADIISSPISTPGSMLINFLTPRDAFAQTPDKTSLLRGSAITLKEQLIIDLTDANTENYKLVIQKILGSKDKYIPIIEEIIQDAGSSDKATNAALTIVRKISTNDFDQLKPETVSRLVTLLYNDNYSLRNNALRSITSHRDSTNYNLSALITNAINSAKKNKLDNANIAYLALAKMQLLYGQGIDLVNSYTEKNYTDLTPITNAIKKFNEGWELHKLTDDEYTIFFITALWGKALAAHDHYWVVKRVSNNIDKNLQQNAVNCFKEFLDAYNSCTNKEQYPYADNVSRAKRYIESPYPDSLK